MPDTESTEPAPDMEAVLSELRLADATHHEMIQHAREVRAAAMLLRRDALHTAIESGIGYQNIGKALGINRARIAQIIRTPDATAQAERESPRVGPRKRVVERDVQLPIPAVHPVDRLECGHLLPVRGSGTPQTRQCPECAAEAGRPLPPPSRPLSREKPQDADASATRAAAARLRRSRAKTQVA